MADVASAVMADFTEEEHRKFEKRLHEGYTLEITIDIICGRSGKRSVQIYIQHAMFAACRTVHS